MVMTDKEKVKAYDEAIERANKVLLDCTKEERNVVEFLHPELKESEGERMRKWIINYLSNRILNSTILVEKENLKKAIAWLEKQGEQKPCDGYAYPKYKVGETLIKKGYSEHTIERVYFCKDPVYVCKTDEGESHISFSEQDTWILKQKSSWNEDDEANLDYLIGFCNSYNNGNKPILVESTARSLSNWLYRIKSGEIKLKRNEFSEDDSEKTIHLACEFIRHRATCNDSINGIDCKELIKRLKSLRPKSTWKPSEEQLNSLYDVLNPCDGFNREVLESLYQDLKKLTD